MASSSSSSSSPTSVAMRSVWSNPSLLEVVLSFSSTLNDVKRGSGVNRAARRSRWPFETLSGHVTIRQMITRSSKHDESYVSVGRVAEAPKLSDAAIGAMIEQLCSHRALSSGGSLAKQLCRKCARTLRAGSRASAARAAFSLGYACVRSENGWANAHAIVGACAHAALAAVAFSQDDNDREDPTSDDDEEEEDTSATERGCLLSCGALPPPPPTGRKVSRRQSSLLPSSNLVSLSYNTSWGPREASSWALVQLLSVTKKRQSTKSLVTQLRHLGVLRACASALAAPRQGASDALRELAGQLLYLTATGEPEYVDLAEKLDLEAIARFGCDAEGCAAAGFPTVRAMHAAQFAVAHGLHLPSADRKATLARAVVDEARDALDSVVKDKVWTPKAKCALARLVVVAETCVEEIANAGAVDVCAGVLHAFSASSLPRVVTAAHRKNKASPTTSQKRSRSKQTSPKPESPALLKKKRRKSKRDDTAEGTNNTPLASPALQDDAAETFAADDNNDDDDDDDDDNNLDTNNNLDTTTNANANAASPSPKKAAAAAGAGTGKKKKKALVDEDEDGPYSSEEARSTISWAMRDPLGIAAVGDAALVLEQVATFYAELDDDDDDLLEDAAAAENEHQGEDPLSERAATRARRETIQESLRLASPTAAVATLSSFGGVDLAALEKRCAQTILRTADALASYVTARAPDRDDVSSLLESDNGLVDALVAVERNRVRATLRRQPEDPRFYFGSYANSTVLAVLAALYDADRGRAALSRYFLTKAHSNDKLMALIRKEVKRQKEDAAKVLFTGDEEDDGLVVLPANGADLEVDIYGEPVIDDDDDDDDDDDLFDDDDDDDEDGIYIVVEEQEIDDEEEDDDDDDEP